MVLVKKVQSKFIPALLSSFVRSPLQDVVLSGTIPHLEFTLEIQSNNLTYQGNPYTEYQQFLYTLIKSLHDKGYGDRRISHKLNKWGLQTPRGKTY